MTQTKVWLVLFCGLMALLWSLTIPLWQFPDEQAHFAEIQDYAEMKQIPAGNDVSWEIFESERLLGTLRDTQGHNQYTDHADFQIPYSSTIYGYNELYLNSLSHASRTHMVIKEAANYPPLYYILGSFAYQQLQFNSLFARVFATRFVSVILFTLLVLSGFALGQELFPQQPFLQISLTCLVGLQSMLMFVGSGVNNDILIDLVGALLLVKSVTILRRSMQFSDLVQLLLIVIIGILTKQLIYPLLPAVTIAVITSYIVYRPSRRVTFCLIGTGLTAIGAYILLVHFNRGFWLPYWPVSRYSFSAIVSMVGSIFLKLYKETLPWYWGVYRWLNLVLPLWLLRLIKLLMGISVIGWSITVYRQRRTLSFRQALPWLWLAMANVIYIGLLVVWEATLTLDHGFGLGLQGRYFFPLITGQMAFLLGGWWLLVRQFLSQKIFCLMVFMIMIAFNLFSLGSVLSVYYDLHNLNRFLVEISQYKPFMAKWPNLFIPVFLAVSVFITFVYRLVTSRIEKK